MMLPPEQTVTLSPISYLTVFTNHIMITSTMLVIKKNFRPRSGRNMDYSGDKPESGSDNRPPIQCTYCNMRGHTEVTCYRKS